MTKYTIWSRAIKKLKDRYNFIKQLSANKKAVVYLGYDDITRVQVIIKELLCDANKKENDFSVLRKLRHPGLPVICDAFEVDDRMFIIMGEIEGGDLIEFINSKCGLDEDKALEIILGLLEVLDYLHTIKPRAIVHGDIKPENIIYNNGRVVLIDFGSVDENEGSAGFCAPERFAGIHKSVESDIYSVGELLHFLIVGNVKKVYSRKKPLGMSDDIYKIIDKSTKKLPSERYRKASEMACAVQRIIKMRKAGIKEDNRANVICLPGCPEAACEMAYSISRKKRNVLIVDLDMLSPCIHTILGMDKFSYCLQDFLSDEPDLLKTKCENIKKSNLYMLPCRVDYENYEKSESDCMLRIMRGSAGYFDTVVISCSGFPYDRYFIDSMFYSNITVFPIVRGVIDIRNYNSMIRFLCQRQNLLAEKLVFMSIDILTENISNTIASGAVETTWVGSIPYSPLRMQLYSAGKAYVFYMKKRICSRYFKILKKTGVLN